MVISATGALAQQREEEPTENADVDLLVLIYLLENDKTQIP